MVVPLAEALHHLHTVGLVHGDLKPANVLLTEDGRPLLADLGVARLPVEAGETEVWATDRWSAPEVLQGQPADAASDAYGLGAIAWACATGAPPPPAALRPLLTDEADHLPSAMCDVITACLSHTASARPSPTQFAELIWACGPAEPAPVALSRGARTAPTVRDPGDELTRRLRSQARASVLTPAVEPTGRRWRRGSSRGSSAPAAAGPASSRSGSLPCPVPGSRRQARARARAAAGATRGQQDRRGWWSVRRSWVAAGVSVGAVAVGCGVVASGGSPSAAVATHSTPSAATPSAPTTSTALAIPSAPTTSTAVTTHAAPTTSAAPATPAARSTALVDPVAVLQPLLTARAAAWNRTDSASLGAAFAANSTAWQRDSGDLKTVADRSAHYSGLDFRVQRAQITAQMPGRASVRAEVVRTAATMTVGAVQQPVPEQVSTVDFTLVRTAEGWRIDSWRSV